jgi:hypothetical protein
MEWWYPRRNQVVGSQDAALVIAVEVNFHFGTVGQAPTVVFIQLIQDTGVPAIAPLITFRLAILLLFFGRLAVCSPE